MASSGWLGVVLAGGFSFRALCIQLRRRTVESVKRRDESVTLLILSLKLQYVGRDKLSAVVYLVDEAVAGVHRSSLSSLL